ncbi:hypothetical protein [Streptomyces chattanoogensis]|uniref:hypothetical protein n=1 Tax=Streptomyces chattanoogensis TaxID=66876 RepID=UPI003680CB96
MPSPAGHGCSPTPPLRLFPASPLEPIQRCLDLQRDLDDYLAVAVRQALGRGASWPEISSRMSLREALPLLEGHWDGSASIDATAIGTYARGLASDNPVTSTDPDAAWYVRTTQHKGPLALDDLTPAQQNKKGAKLQKKKDRIKKRLFGYDASLVVACDPHHDGAPLPDGSADPDVVPALVIAFSVDKPSHRPGHVATEALQQVDDSLPRGYLAGDRAYNGQKPENFQLPIRAMGYEPVYDYSQDQLGVQAGFAGAELVEGNWYCPAMPQELKDTTKDLIAEKIDKQTWIERIRARAAYLFMPKQRPDAEGHRRMMCLAEAGRTQCPLKKYILGRGIRLPQLARHADEVGECQEPRKFHAELPRLSPE